MASFAIICEGISENLSLHAIPEKIEQILHEIDMGLWDNYLFGNYEMYKNAKSQIEMANAFQKALTQQQQMNMSDTNK